MGFFNWFLKKEPEEKLRKELTEEEKQEKTQKAVESIKKLEDNQEKEKEPTCEEIGEKARKAIEGIAGLEPEKKTEEDKEDVIRGEGPLTEILIDVIKNNDLDWVNISTFNSIIYYTRLTDNYIVWISATGDAYKVEEAYDWVVFINPATIEWEKEDGIYFDFLNELQKNTVLDRIDSFMKKRREKHVKEVEKALLALQEENDKRGKHG
jgi:hypothetical protein